MTPGILVGASDGELLGVSVEPQDCKNEIVSTYLVLRIGNSIWYASVSYVPKGIKTWSMI